MESNTELLKILDRIDTAAVLVVGDVMLDRYWSGKASRISPEAPVPVVALDKVTNIPGGAANVAANIAGLGAKVYLAGVVGSDTSGNDLRNALAARNIPDEYIVASPSRCTTTKTRVLVHNQQIARVDEETDRPLEDSDETAVLAKIEKALPHVHAVVLSDYAKGCLTDTLISQTIRLAREAGKTVIVDPKSRDLTKYNGATLLTPNLAETLAAAGIDKGGEDRADEAAATILSRTDTGSLLVTLGEHGMKLYRRDSEPVHFPSAARQVFDVTGAGDTVVAFLAAALSAGAQMHAAISFANIGAGLAVEKVGTSVITPAELHTALAEPRENVL